MPHRWEPVPGVQRMSTVGDVIYVYDERRKRRRRREEAAGADFEPGPLFGSPPAEVLPEAAAETALAVAEEVGPEAAVAEEWAEPVAETVAETEAEAEVEAEVEAEPEPETELAPDPEPEPAPTWRLGAWGKHPDPAVTRPTTPIRRAPADFSRVMPHREEARGARVLSHEQTGFVVPPEGYAVEFGTGRLVPVRPLK